MHIALICVLSVCATHASAPQTSIGNPYHMPLKIWGRCPEDANTTMVCLVQHQQPQLENGW